jgi:hypothetical protein
MGSQQASLWGLAAVLVCLSLKTSSRISKSLFLEEAKSAFLNPLKVKRERQSPRGLRSVGLGKSYLRPSCARPLAGPRISSAALASPRLPTCPAAWSARHRLVWLPSCLLWSTTWLRLAAAWGTTGLRLAAARGTTGLLSPAPGSWVSQAPSHALITTRLEPR